MEIVERITKNLKIVLDNKIEEQALENVFYAKFCHWLQLKNIKFTSINNLKTPQYLSYYAINFVCSGGEKNQTLKNIDNFLLPYVKEEHIKINNDIRQEMVAEEKEIFEGTKFYQQECKKIDKKYNNADVMVFKTNGGTPAVIYDKAHKIYQYKKGALFAQMSEFSDYFTTSVDNKLSNNKTFLDMINNLYDGVIEPSDSLGTNRKELNNIPFSLLFLSDIEEILEEKNNSNFKKRLKTGWGRRINFYFDKNINYFKNPPKQPTKEEKIEAYSNLEFIANELNEIYKEIPFGQEFIFSEEANDTIEEWKRVCRTECQNFYKYTDTLNLDNKIKLIELDNSPWKIIKMSVIMQVLLNKKTFVVTQDAVVEAIKFYSKCRECLYDLLGEKQITQEEDICNFFLNNQNIEFNLTQLKAQNFVSRSDFSLWFKTSFDEICNLIETKGYELEVKRRKKSVVIKCVKQINPEDIKINISISNDNAEHPVKGYKPIQLTTQEFIDLIPKTKAFSSQQFKDGYRKDSNIIGNQNTIWLDFDDGLTIDNAKEKFKDYWYVIYTSINHQKKKGYNAACDRFRLILKTKNYMPKEKEEYRKIMANICKEYGADKACKDLSRYYRGNKDALIFINNGRFFDYQNFNKEEENKKTKINLIKNKKDTITSENIDVILKSDEIVAGNRDAALSYSVGVLISAVKNGDISHENAQIWLENKLNEIMTPDFKENANKYRKRLERLEF